MLCFKVVKKEKGRSVNKTQKKDKKKAALKRGGQNHKKKQFQIIVYN